MAKNTESNVVSLFAAYQAIEDKLTEAKAAVLSSIDERSKQIKVIHAACGKGPFQWHGHTVVIVCRKGKDEEGNVTGQETWFFKEIGKEVQTIG